MITQDERFIAITTPLGKDVLLLSEFSGQEGISRLYSYKLQLISENHNIPFKDIIGKSVVVSIVGADGEPRTFHGLISDFSQSGGSGEEAGTARFSHYSATLVPWCWLLTQTRNSRIFQEKNVPDIIESIFKEKGFNDFVFRLQGTYQPRNYCVQYREADFTFISRLLEEEGIYYFFEHDDKKHTLILADSSSEHPPCPKQEIARCQGVVSADWFEEDVITAVELKQQICPGQYTLGDYNFEMPAADLKVSTITNQDIAPTELEIYDYPGEYEKMADGKSLVDIRMQEKEAQITQVTGSSNCRNFISGHQFVLANHYRADLNNKGFVLTNVAHQASQNGYLPEEQVQSSYRNDFECIPVEVPYRPPRLTQRPVIDGVQTAIVVGPAGEEIYTDEHGRVKVLFHWDREGKGDENSSCWIRVSQAWAGAKWGAMYIPRIGHEVVVDFIEGDPDRPIIVGRVYHGNNQPPYALPDEKTKSTLKSDSSPGGGGFNEIRFEDKKGDEQIFIHAEKDQDVRIKNDVRQWVGNDSHLIVKNNQVERIDGDQHLKVIGDQNILVNGTISREAGMDLQEKTGMKHALDAGMEIHLKAGMNVVIEAGATITLKAGGGFIVVGPAGVAISGTPVLINSGGSAMSGSGASPASPIEPVEADNAAAGGKGAVGRVPPPPPPPLSYSPQAMVLKEGAQSGVPFCDTCPKE